MKGAKEKVRCEKRKFLPSQNSSSVGQRANSEGAGWRDHPQEQGQGSGCFKKRASSGQRCTEVKYGKAERCLLDLSAKSDLGRTAPGAS